MAEKDSLELLTSKGHVVEVAGVKHYLTKKGVEDVFETKKIEQQLHEGNILAMGDGLYALTDKGRSIAEHSCENPPVFDDELFQSALENLEKEGHIVRSDDGLSYKMTEKGREEEKKREKREKGRKEKKRKW